MSLFISTSCVAMELLHVSRAVFRNSFSASPLWILEDLCRIELFGKVGLDWLDVVFSGM